MAIVKRHLGFVRLIILCVFLSLGSCGDKTTKSITEFGTIVIDQTPNFLSGAGWILNGPQNESGTGDITLTDVQVGDYR
jgi:hypothetical protein